MGRGSGAGRHRCPPRATGRLIVASDEQPQRPTQVVILAGGRGTRLAPLTDTRPKAMIEFHGRPFLEYLIELVRDEGFERVLLLLGYLAVPIQTYFGTGRRWGVDIEYSVSAAEDETGRRLRLAAPRIDPVFLLMYCDNYWPMSIRRMWDTYVTRRPQGMLTIYENGDGYTRDNVRLDGERAIVVYDKDRRTPGLRGVEIGFGLFRREVLERIPDGNASFERVVYPRLVAERQLDGFVTEHRYYSVSTHERLPATEQFLARRPTVILDRDGVLNRRRPRAEYVRSWSDWEWLPGTREALRLFKEAGYRVLVISNQAGVARGQLTEAALGAIHERLKAEVREAGGDIDRIYHCPHGWDQGCACRKPRPGMVFQAQRDFHLDLSRAHLIGDDERDGQAAEAAGCPWTLVSEERSLLDVARDIVDGRGMQRKRRFECAS